MATPAMDHQSDETAISRIRGLLPSLRRSDALVATVLLERADRVGMLSVTDVSALAGTSESTVVRACQRLGFRGYHDAKRVIAAEGAPAGDGEIDEEVVASDSRGQVLEKVITSSAITLRKSLTTLDRSAFSAATQAVAAAGKVLVIGVGPSSPVAQDAAYRLRMLGVNVDSPVDSLTQHLGAGLLRKGDVCLVVSHTGATRETLLAAETSLSAGATVIAITSFARSPLTKLAHHSLVSGGQGSGVRVEAMASRLAHLAVIDALHVCLAVEDSPQVKDALKATRDVAIEHQL